MAAIISRCISESQPVISLGTDFSEITILSSEKTFLIMQLKSDNISFEVFRMNFV